MLKTMTFRSMLIAVACAISFAAYAMADTPRKVDVPAGELTVALRQLAEQSGVEFVYSVDELRGVRTGGVHGEYTAEKAVTKLLEGTELKLTVHESGALLIAPSASLGSLDSSSSTAVSPQSADSSGARSGGTRAFRLAQVETQNPANPENPENRKNDSPSSEGESGIQGEVVVTGTHIRGLEVPIGSNVIVIDREQIDRSGYATVQDVLKTLPQVFGGGVTEDDITDTSALNLNFGNAVNLRGLGADSTLVLINGRRQPAGGLNGAFSDISSIATASIERIEVLADGASAIYGSDAVGGVVNFVLRKDYEGAETRVRPGTLGGDASEDQISQLLGTSWNSGNVLVGYQYYKRNALARSARSYTVTDDLRRFGGSDFRSRNDNPGNILCPTGVATCTAGLPAFAIPSGQDGSQLLASDLLPNVVNLHNSSEQGDLLPSQRTQSVFLNASQELGDRFELFAEGRYGTREAEFRSSSAIANLIVPSTNPFFVDPFGGRTSVTVAYNFLNDLGPVNSASTTDTYTATLGLTANLDRKWRVTTFGAYGNERSSYQQRNIVNTAALTAALTSSDATSAFNPFGDGSATNPATLAGIRAVQLNRADADVQTLNITADGPLLALGGGDAALAVGIDHRNENLVSSRDFTARARASNDTGRRVLASFAELSLPFVTRKNATKALRRLELSIAGRYEDYDDFGTTFNPRYAVSWSPLDTVTVNGTWGTSFKAPRLTDMLDSTTANTGSANLALILPVIDPQSSTGVSNALIRTGGNTALQPETATTWTAGISLSPITENRIGASLSYFSIDYRDRIAAGGPPGNPFSILLEENVWRDLVERNPSRADVDAICNSPQYLPLGNCAVLPAAILDLRLRNLAAIRVRGLDFDLSGHHATEYGDIGVRLGGTYVLQFERRVTDSAPAVDIADTLGNVPALRLRGSISWNRGGFAAEAGANHTGSYRDSISTPNRSIGSWTTVDVALSYRVSAREGLLSGLQFGVNGVNVLGRRPPFVNVGSVGQAFGYDTANADLSGPVLSVQVKKSW